MVDVGFDKHFRVNHADNQFANGANHINDIESFWSFAKRSLHKFNDVRRSPFYLHLKECVSFQQTKAKHVSVTFEIT